MRNIILNEKKYWKIIAGDNFSDDICTQLDIEQINKEDLPYNNSYFIVLSKEHQEYFEYLKDVIMSNDTEWEKIDFERIGLKNDLSKFDFNMEVAIKINPKLEIYKVTIKLLGKK